MKVSSLHIAVISTVLVILPTQSAAIECGIKGITKPCRGDTDIRYDPNASYDLKEQDSFWKSLEGLYVGDMKFFYDDGTPETKYGNGLPEDLGTFDMSKAKSFVNITVDGSRLYYHRYIMAKHNSDGPGGVQLPGFVSPIDIYAASTFKKNSEAKLLGIVNGYGKELVAAGENSSTLKHIPDKIFLLATPITDHPVVDRSLEYYDSMYCIDSNCNETKTYSELYETDKEGTPYIRYSRTSSKKVDKDMWMEEFNKTFNEFYIPPSDDPFTGISEVNFNTPTFTQPFNINSGMTPECITLVCPTEEDWKLVDPYLGKSSYIEPDGILTSNFVTGVTIASVTCALLLFFTIYKRGVMNRENRVKEVVLKSMAATMALKISKNLTADELKMMFKRIDIDGNGQLDKNEMRRLVEDAGVANMSDKDYDLLFTTIDLDKNGTLDFVEFCAFFSSISIDERSRDKFEDA